MSEEDKAKMMRYLSIKNESFLTNISGGFQIVDFPMIAGCWYSRKPRVGGDENKAS